MSTHKKTIVIISILTIAALVISSIFYFGLKSTKLPYKPVAKKAVSYYYVSKVVDGDTLKLSSGKRVRLIGVDTPEVHYSNKLIRDAKKSKKDVGAIQALGKKASDFTKRLAGNKKVYLEYDVEKKDKYGRTLAYVYLEEGTFVNAKIIEEGYGQVMTIPPNVKYADYFLKLQRKARDQKKGLWGKM